MQEARHPKDRQVHALLTDADARRLREAAQREDVSMSQLVRRLIRTGLADEESPREVEL